MVGVLLSLDIFYHISILMELERCRTFSLFPRSLKYPGRVEGNEQLIVNEESLKMEGHNLLRMRWQPHSQLIVRRLAQCRMENVECSNYDYLIGG